MHKHDSTRITVFVVMHIEYITRQFPSWDTVSYTLYSICFLLEAVM